MRLVLAQAAIAAWLASPASCFSPPAGPHSRISIISSSGGQQQQQHEHDRSMPNVGASTGGRRAAAPSELFLSQSANDNMSGFHYDKQTRGTSFISQVSQQDLWERRQLKRPQRRAEMREARRVSPNSRGGGFARGNVNGGGDMGVNGAVNGVGVGAPGEGFARENVNGGGDMGVNGAVNGVGAPGPGFAREYANDNSDMGVSGAVNGVSVGAPGGAMEMSNDNQNLESFKESVSTNLKSMTELLREMQLSQSIQSNDVQALGRRVFDMAERLYDGSANSVNQNGGNGSSSNKRDDKNFGTALDGEFHQKIKNVIDEFDVVQQQGAAAAAAANNYGTEGMSGAGEAYYREKITQLEARINEIDESLMVTEDKVDEQMEYMDMLVNQRLDGINDDRAFDFDGMPPPGPGGPRGEPRGEPFPPPPPPTFEHQQNMQSSMPPPPPPMSPQEGGGQQRNENSNSPHPYNNMDDGRGYYQERNYNDFHEPSRPIEISSSQQQQQTKSVNTRSGGQHYNDKNSSFMSSFSKMDNERRREFQPFRDPHRNQVSVNEQLPRGVTNAQNRRYSMVGPPPPPMVEQPNGGGGMGSMDYYNEPYYYEDSGPMGYEDSRPMGYEDSRPMGYEDSRPMGYEDSGPMGMGMMQDDYFYDDMRY